MTYWVKRSCTEVVQMSGEKISRPIEDLRSRAAYVILGDPGSGKTELLKAEAVACDGFYVTARIHASSSDPSALRKIAEEIRDGKIEDPEDELLGRLLHELFPHAIKRA